MVIVGLIIGLSLYSGDPIQNIQIMKTFEQQTSPVLKCLLFERLSSNGIQLLDRYSNHNLKSIQKLFAIQMVILIADHSIIGQIPMIWIPDEFII